MAPDALTLPLTVSHRDLSGLFAIETTVVAWREDHPGTSRDVALTLGAGTLHDADKGAFPLDGLELIFRVVEGRAEPMAVRNPGPLSEVQQEVLLDAVGTALAAAGYPSPQSARSDP